MKRCANCKTQFTGVICPRCGDAFVSVSTDSLDSMVEAASVPNLAAMFRAAKAMGAIGAVSVYAGQDQGA